jgi:hypothetical protein
MKTAENRLGNDLVAGVQIAPESYAEAAFLGPQPVECLDSNV